MLNEQWSMTERWSMLIVDHWSLGINHWSWAFLGQRFCRFCCVIHNDAANGRPWLFFSTFFLTLLTILCNRPSVWNGNDEHTLMTSFLKKSSQNLLHIFPTPEYWVLDLADQCRYILYRHMANSPYYHLGCLKTVDLYVSTFFSWFSFPQIHHNYITFALIALSHGSNQTFCSIRFCCCSHLTCRWCTCSRSLFVSIVKFQLAFIWPGWWLHDSALAGVPACRLRSRLASGKALETISKPFFK